MDRRHSSAFIGININQQLNVASSLSLFFFPEVPTLPPLPAHSKTQESTLAGVGSDKRWARLGVKYILRLSNKEKALWHRRRCGRAGAPS